MPFSTRACKISRSVSAGLHLIFAQAIDFSIARVGDHDALLGIVQADALRHVAKRGRKARIDQFEFGGLFLDELGLRALRGDVLVDADPAAARNRGLDDGDDPPVRQVDRGKAFAGLAQLAAEFVDKGGRRRDCCGFVGKLHDIDRCSRPAARAHRGI